MVRALLVKNTSLKYLKKSSGAGAMFMKQELRSRSCISFTTAQQP